MTVGELKEILNDCPDNAIIYVEADHGQLPEQANSVSYSDEQKLTYYGDDFEWFDGDDKSVENGITAICIGY